MTKVAIARIDMTPEDQAKLKSYQIGVTEDGEPVSQFKYSAGMPRQYRFDAKEGKFKLSLGGDNLRDMGRTMSFRPLAWRVFNDPELFKIKNKTWAELFFIDDKNCVSAILFHGFSVKNLEELMGPLFYDDLNLADVILSITAEKKTRDDNGVYYIANFDYQLADAIPAELRDFLADSALFRADTLTDLAEVRFSHGMAYTMLPHPEADPLQLAVPAE